MIQRTESEGVGEERVLLTIAIELIQQLVLISIGCIGSEFH